MKNRRSNKIIRVATVPQSLKILLKGQLRFLSQFYEVVGVASAGSQLEDTTRQEGIRTRPVEIKRQISLSADVKALWNLYKVFRQERPLMVHSITPKAGLLSMTAAKLAGVPIRIHTFTGLIFPYRKGLIRKILWLMDWCTCLAATKVYPEGKGVMRDLVDAKVTQKPLNVIANGNINGINTRYYSSECVNEEDLTMLKAELGIAPQDFVFVYVGRLVKDKGINELVSAFKHLGSNIETKLLLVGKFEPDLDPLSSGTLQEIEKNEGIICVGYQTDVRPYFAVADALVFPSYREGFPNVVMQAGAMGLPSIVTDISGCNEIILEGENGTLVPVKDVDALKKAMTKMQTDTFWRKSLQENARKLILARYEQRDVWEAILKEYNELIKNYES